MQSATIPSEFSRVLRRYDYDVRVQQRYHAYDCVVRSQIVELNGVSAHTLFFPIGKELAALRATGQGWSDETTQWHKAQNAPPARSMEPLRHALQQMEWNALRTYAVDRDLDAGGKRDDLVGRILAWHCTQSADAQE